MFQFKLLRLFVAAVAAGAQALATRRFQSDEGYHAMRDAEWYEGTASDNGWALWDAEQRRWAFVQEVAR